MQMVFRLRANNCNYFSVGSVACIVLLLSGFIQSYSYVANLSFDSRAFGQVPNVEVGDGQVKIGRGQEPNVEVGDGQVKIGDRKSTRLNSSHGYISYAVFC